MSSTVQLQNIGARFDRGSAFVTVASHMPSPRPIHLVHILLLLLLPIGVWAQSDSDASLTAATKLMYQGESAKAVEILAPLATAGNLAAQHNLAMVYATGGTGVEKDYDKALVWYRAAAKHRFIPSIHNLGVMYQLGQAVQVDYARALQFYLVAGQYGYAPALASAAYVFAKGLGRPADYVDAYAYLLNADVFGDANAKHGLARLRAVMTTDQVHQAEHVAAGLAKRYQANIQRCRRAIEARNRHFGDEAVPAKGMLLVACESAALDQPGFELPVGIALISIERSPLTSRVVGIAKDNEAVSQFLGTASRAQTKRAVLHEISASTRCSRRVSWFVLTIDASLDLPPPQPSEAAACEALFGTGTD